VTREISILAEIADAYDVLVFDQWGVLHNGAVAYPGALACITRLQGRVLAVLSNSGKRGAPNAQRIAAMGFEPESFRRVMTSGEALWRDIERGRVPQRRFFPIERQPGDAAAWAAGLDISLCELEDAEAVLLMGLPDASTLDEWEPVLSSALALGLPVHCSNPDRKSPRAGGEVISPGAIAFHYVDMGGEVSFYGKPHGPVFEALEAALPGRRYLMVGDSLEHDIAGASGAGWDSVFVTGGLYRERFAAQDVAETLASLAAEISTPLPTYVIGELA